MQKEVIITNIHERGFGFAALTENGDHAFLPPFVCNEAGAQVGDVFIGTLVINNGKYDTPYQCVKLERDLKAEVIQLPVERDIIGVVDVDEVLNVLWRATSPITTRYVADCLGISDTKQLTKVLLSLWTDGRIYKADVSNDPTAKRTSLTMWSHSLAAFRSVCA